MVPNLRHLLPQVLVAGVLPVIVYAILRPHVSSDAVALSAVMVFPLAEVGVERYLRGRFEPIGIIAMISILIGLFGAVALHGDTLLLKIRDSSVTGTFGAVCLASLAARRPAMFYLGRSFATGGDPDKQADFDQIWELPTVAYRFRVVTATWGVVLLTEAAVRIALALALSTQIYLVVAQVLNWSAIGGLMLFTVTYSRAGEQQVIAAMTEATADQPIPVSPVSPVSSVSAVSAVSPVSSSEAV
jgi:hypothetical protein